MTGENMKKKEKNFGNGEATRAAEMGDVVNYKLVKKGSSSGGG